MQRFFVLSLLCIVFSWWNALEAASASYTPLYQLEGKQVAKFENAAVSALASYQNDVYAGLSNGNLVQYSPEAQKHTISVKFESAIRALIQHERHLYVGLENGTLCQYDLQTKTYKQISFGASISSLVHYQNLIYVGLKNGRLGQYHPSSNQSNVVTELGNTIQAMAEYGGAIYAGCDSGQLWKCTLDGKKEQIAHFSKGVLALAPYGDQIYAGLADGRVSACPPNAGSNCKERAHFNGSINLLFPYQGYVYTAVSDGRLCACYPDSNANCPKVVDDFASPVRSMLQLNGVFYLGHQDGTLTACSPSANIEILTKFGSAVQVIAKDNDRLLVSLENGLLSSAPYASPNSHEVLMDVSSPIYAMALGGGTIFVGCKNGTVWRYKDKKAKQLADFSSEVRRLYLYETSLYTGLGDGRVSVCPIEGGICKQIANFSSPVNGLFGNTIIVDTGEKSKWGQPVYGPRPILNTALKDGRYYRCPLEADTGEDCVQLNQFYEITVSNVLAGWTVIACIDGELWDVEENSKSTLGSVNRKIAALEAFYHDDNYSDIYVGCEDGSLWKGSIPPRSYHKLAHFDAAIKTLAVFGKLSNGKVAVDVGLTDGRVLRVSD